MGLKYTGGVSSESGETTLVGQKRQDRHSSCSLERHHRRPCRLSSLGYRELFARRSSLRSRSDPRLSAERRRDLATYAVSDNLGSGLVLLLLVPTVALALGSLSARFVSEPKS